MPVTSVSLGLVAVAALIAHPGLRRFGPRFFLVLALAPLLACALYAAQLPGILDGVALTEHVSWVPAFGLDWSFRVDLLAELFALLVSGAGGLILIYCRWYFSDSEDGLARFGATFVAFAGAMLGLVVADNVYLMFVFWEATTVLSFLLIGHASKRWTSRSAALQALIVTTLGGLAMLAGLVALVALSGTTSLHGILQNPPMGGAAVAAVYLVLLGALSKSAIIPFQFWLPGAMAAPTPVSAYLHAAAMVKAGILILARFGPAFGDMPGYRATLVVLGGATMLHGALRALRQYDLKLILAFGTVSQLGMLTMLYGLADPRTDAAATVLLFAHALGKAPLFLAVGIIDHRVGTRDLRKISGLGRQAPVLAVTAALAGASMVGLPPLLGFVGKEAALTELIVMLPEGDTASPALGWFALIVMILGSICTTAYVLRFLWGSFARKRGVDGCSVVHRQHPSILFAPIVFVVAAIAAGIGATALDPFIQELAQQAVPAGASDLPDPAHLALWHGLTLALLISVFIIALGVLLFFTSRKLVDRLPIWPERFTASHGYFATTRAVDEIALRVTGFTQRGSLPYYLAVILCVTVVAMTGTLFASGQKPVETTLATNAVQPVLAVLMIAAAIATLRATKRFQALILVGFTGYGMAALYAFHGAPDLALTQVLVETVTLIAFVLVIRRLPQRMMRRSTRKIRIGRVALGTALGVLFGAALLFALGARVADPISLELPRLAVEGGHGINVVNVMLVDIRGWDTLGELSVVLSAATGVASLVFLRNRSGSLPKLSRRDARSRVRAHLQRVADPQDRTERGTWILAGRRLDPANRSIILEVVVRLVFHALIILSIYLLLAGHNAPGGGFAGGLVAGVALVARYLAGGRHELGATVPFDAGRILGTGLAIAVATAAMPLLFGQAALSSSWFDLDLGPFGHLSFVTSTLFDIGVYLVVFGLVLDVLRSLGSQVDVYEEGEEIEEIADTDGHEHHEDQSTGPYAGRTDRGGSL